MSFLDRMGLGFLDPTNELDKLANAAQAAVKKKDPSVFVDQIGASLEALEDRFDDVGEDLEKTVNEMKKQARQEIKGVARQAKKALEKQRQGMVQGILKDLDDEIQARVTAEVEKQLEEAKAREAE